MVGIGREGATGGARRGDIHLVASPDGPRPAVVVRTDRMAKGSTVIVVPMTSAPRSAEMRPPYLVSVGARESGLDRDGFAKCDQVLTFPAAMLGPRVGRLSPAALSRVGDALRFVLDL